MIEMSFSKKTLLILMLITLALLPTLSKAEHVDIGYRDGLMVSSLINVDSIYYVQAEYYSTGKSIGGGIGYNSNKFNLALTVSKVYNVTTYVNTQLQANYYDVNISYVVAIDYSNDTGLGYKIGAGYALTESVSIIASYSNNGAFIGIRRTIN